MGDLPNCPAYRSYDVRVLSHCDDGLISYVCHDCRKVFHVPEPARPPRAKSDEQSIVTDAGHRKVR